MARIDFQSPRWMYQEHSQHYSFLEKRVLSFAYVAYVMDRADALPDKVFDTDLADQLADMIWDGDSYGYTEEDFKRSTYSYAFETFDGGNVMKSLNTLNQFDRQTIARIAHNIVGSFDHMRG